MWITFLRLHFDPYVVEFLRCFLEYGQNRPGKRAGIPENARVLE